jgi:hypothetical protein
MNASNENQIIVREDYNVQNVIDRVLAVKKLYDAVMEKDQHYGVIPGTSKPTLYKAGAEKILAMFSLAARTEKNGIRDLSDGHREYIITIGLYKKNSSEFWGDGSGSCSTMEKKFRYVNGQERSDLADVYNVVLKMAEKRALVSAVLKATGVSDIFTQDLEDMAEPIGTPITPITPIKNNKLDFNDVFSVLKNKTVDEMTDYRIELDEKFPSMSDKQKAALDKIFQKAMNERGPVA